MNQSNQRKESGCNSGETKAKVTAELQTTDGTTIGMRAGKKCVDSRRAVVSEIEIFRDVLKGLTPKENEKN